MTKGLSSVPGRYRYDRKKRNPCPHGSGKKYKKCCGKDDIKGPVGLPRNVDQPVPRFGGLTMPEDEEKGKAPYYARTCKECDDHIFLGQIWGYCRKYNYLCKRAYLDCNKHGSSLKSPWLVFIFNQGRPKSSKACPACQGSRVKDSWMRISLVQIKR